MLVRTLKQHNNEFGKDYTKKVGAKYDHPTPELLIERGTLEAANGGRGQNRGAARTRTNASRTAKGNSKKRASPRTNKGGENGSGGHGGSGA